MDAPERALSLSGLEELNPMQLKALEGKWQEESLVVSSPTASGKTLVSEIFALDSIMNRRQKVVYTCPLRALASEHFSEFKKKYSGELGIKAALSIGDLDSKSSYLGSYDIIFTTYEKLDSLLRHRAEWLSSVGLLVVDEVHMLGSDRGPTIEMALTKLRHLNPGMQALALSATIPNAGEIADWLHAKLVESSYRPVPLKEGIFFNGTVEYSDGKEEVLSVKEPLKAVLRDTVFEKGKQAMVFANTRKRAESIALKLSEQVEKGLSQAEKKALEREGSLVLSALEQPTEQCKRLSGLVSKGVAFHHAGLLSKQREIIEQAFKSNRLKLIAATPTLCLVPETRIWNGVEESRVDSFEFNQRLLALKGNKLVSIRPQAIVKQSNDKTIVNIRSVSGFSIKLTEDHKVLLKRGKKRLLVPAEKCKKGDKIAVVGTLWKRRPKRFNLGFFTIDFDKAEFPITDDLFYFIGAMLGDGYSGAERKKGNLMLKATPCLVGRDSEIFDVAKRVCDFYGVFYREGINSYGVPSLFFSKKKWFRLFLLNCGVGKSTKKFIANELMLGPRSSIKALIQGLFDTDGWVGKRGAVGFSNISLSLVKSVQRMLLLFGVVARLRMRPGSKIKLIDKEYKTKKSFELAITQKKSILNFHKLLGFRVKRKQESLFEIASSIKCNIHYLSCPRCRYKLFQGLFSGRNEQHKLWGQRKLLTIKLLGEKGELTSSALAKELGFSPYKRERRLNNHFELIKRTRVGNSKVWQLNDIGKYVHRQLFLRRKKYENLFGLQYCPVCRKKLDPKLKGGWRENDFDGDIFWDFVSKASKEAGKKYPFVFDVVLPSNGSNDHLFVAEGFLVHNSAGVNLPSHTVLIPSLYRYTASGMARIPVSEYKQQVGRAGRPKYDKEGRGIVVASSESEKQEIMESYVKGSLESVSSMLGFEPVLRTHLLGLVSSGFVFDMASMESFFEKTFYAKQFGSLHSLFGKLDSVLRHLQDMGFVERNENRVSATSLGRRVSELYLDPVSAFEMIKAMGASSKFLPLSYLFLLCNCSELMPWLSVSKSNEAGLWEQMQLRKIEMPVDIDRAMFFDMNLLKKFSTSLMLEQWIEEAREQTIMDDFRTQPGILHSKLAISDWLCYSALELARLLGLEMHFGPLSKMRKRLRHGVREELVFLTEVRHIGRVRARRLWRSNVRSIAELKSIDEKDLARIIGEGPARLVKQALGQGKPKA